MEEHFGFKYYYRERGATLIGWTFPLRKNGNEEQTEFVGYVKRREKNGLIDGMLKIYRSLKKGGEGMENSFRP